MRSVTPYVLRQAVTIVAAWVVFCAGVMLGLATQAIFAQSQNLIYGCVDNHNGLLRVSQTCRANETAITWN